MPPSTIPYDQVRAAVAAELKAFASDEPASVPRLVGDLHAEIQEFLDRGGSYPKVSKIFARHSVEASPDGIRAAMRRHGKSLKTVVPTNTAEATSGVPVPVESHDPAEPKPAPAGLRTDQETSAEASIAPAPASSEPPTVHRPPVIDRRLK